MITPANHRKRHDHGEGRGEPRLGGVHRPAQLSVIVLALTLGAVGCSSPSGTTSSAPSPEPSITTSALSPTTPSPTGSTPRPRRSHRATPTPASPRPPAATTSPVVRASGRHV